MGAVIWGGGGKEIVSLPREVVAGDIFFANAHFYQVKMAGLLETDSATESTHIMVVSNLGFMGDF